MFVTLYETAEVHFCLFSTNGLYVKADNEKFIAAGSRCRQNLKRLFTQGDFVARQVALNFEHVRMAAICRATNRSEIGCCSHCCSL